MKKFLGKVKKIIFKNTQLSSVNKKYISTPATKTSLKSLNTNFLLITIVFNDAELIKMQYESLKKLEDEHDYLVVDDSSNVNEAEKIEMFCSKNSISYIHLPADNPGLDGSLCHGLALNWVFYNVVKKIKPQYFGFLDPDLFVISSGSFLFPWEGKDFWGVKAHFSYEEKNKKKNIWRLLPTFCFFKYDFYKDKNLNFLPMGKLDTGGGNFKILKNFNSDHLVQGENIVDKLIYNGKLKIQIFNNVMHLVGGVSYIQNNQNNVFMKKEIAHDLVFGNKKLVDL